jgi:CRP-like cAMP-binding protein
MQAKLRQHIEEIIPLTDDEFVFILSHFSFKKVKKHQFLIQEGDPVNYSYFVASGLLKLSHTDANDKEHILHFAMEDWWVSDYKAYFSGTKATMSLDCLEEQRVLSLLSTSAKERYDQLLMQYPSLIQRINKSLLASYLGVSRETQSRLSA